MYDYAFPDLAINDNDPAMRDEVVEQALDLLDQALTILDSENLTVVAAKVDEARSVLLRDMAMTA
jgi:hypothetical protein